MSNLLLERSALMAHHPLLPREYQQVEYIESTGTQWIDTGVRLSQNSNFDIWFKNKTSNTVGNYGFGYYNCDGFTLEEQAWFTGNILQFGTSLSEGYSFPSGFYNVGIRHIVAINDLLYVDGLLYGSLQRTGTATASATLLLGAGREDAASNIKGSTFGVILGKMTFSTNDIDIFRGIPCYRKSDQKVGLYDTVSNVFLTSQGVGEFVIGENSP